MAWSAPKTWSVGEVVTAAMMNTHVRDNLDYLKGNAGGVTISNRVTAAGVTIETASGGGYSASNPLVIQRTDSASPTGRLEFQGSGGGGGNRWQFVTDADVASDC